MLVSIAADAPQSTIPALIAAAASAGFEARRADDGHGGAVIGVVGALPGDVLTLPGITRVLDKHKPFMMASREGRPNAPTVVRLGDVRIGGGRPVVMAGPCVVEDRATLLDAARAVKAAGADVLRGGAFKPRTSPYAFQGLGEDGLRLLAEAREATGLPVVTEVMEPEQVGLVARYADMLQIGARNMANFPLLKKAGAAGKPVLLKRGFSATVEEWLMAAEYVMASGNAEVVLCERGIRGFDPAFRFNLDLNAVPHAKDLSHLPVVVDPSHGTGRRDLVARMSLAGLACGADGLIVEVHPDPAQALCDGSQTITPDELAGIVRSGRALHETLLGVGADAQPVAVPA